MKKNIIAGILAIGVTLAIEASFLSYYNGDPVKAYEKALVKNKQIKSAQELIRVDFDTKDDGYLENNSINFAVNSDIASQVSVGKMTARFDKHDVEAFLYEVGENIYFKVPASTRLLKVTEKNLQGLSGTDPNTYTELVLGEARSNSDVRSSIRVEDVLTSESRKAKNIIFTVSSERVKEVFSDAVKEVYVEKANDSPLNIGSSEVEVDKALDSVFSQMDCSDMVMTATVDERGYAVRQTIEFSFVQGDKSQRFYFDHELKQINTCGEILASEIDESDTVAVGDFSELLLMLMG